MSRQEHGSFIQMKSSDVIVHCTRALEWIASDINAKHEEAIQDVIDASANSRWRRWFRQPIKTREQAIEELKVKPDFGFCPWDWDDVYWAEESRRVKKIAFAAKSAETMCVTVEDHMLIMLGA